MYRPLFIIICLYLFIFLYSCTPVNYPISTIPQKDNKQTKTEVSNNEEKKETITVSKTESENKGWLKTNAADSLIKHNVTFIISKNDNQNITNQFINILELAVYKKKLKNITFKIIYYKNKKDLNQYLKNVDMLGQIFIGPLNSNDTEIVKKYCDAGAIFFSFASQKNLANQCIYLVNFFPENELREIFKFFPNNSKVAILYPENLYGYEINSMIDHIAEQSNSIIVNRASYNEDMGNVREAIKELGKYELRKYELNRQKKILASKKDTQSKKRLQKLERYKTTKDLDFTHLIIADYGIRLLQVAPLLPYYDIDPNLIRFVGTGVWDDPVFFDEPSLQGSVFPGIEIKKRKDLFDSYLNIYEEKLLRISTLPYDLTGLISYIINKNLTLYELYELLNKKRTIFEGVDGGFYFKDNIIERNLDILEIKNGAAKKIN